MRSEGRKEALYNVTMPSTTTPGCWAKLMVDAAQEQARVVLFGVGVKLNIILETPSPAVQALGKFWRS